MRSWSFTLESLSCGFVKKMKIKIQFLVQKIEVLRSSKNKTMWLSGGCTRLNIYIL